MPSTPPHIFISAGDVSGDIHAAHLISALKRASANVRISGLAGPEASRAGCELVRDLTEHAVLGFRRAVSALPTFMGLLADGARWIEKQKPDVCVLIDFPGFNLNLASLAKRRGIQVVYYICPQLWAWAPWRLRRFRNRVDHALVIFPFEAAFYRDNGIDSSFVGHPVADNLSRLEPPFLDSIERDPNLVCLLPGSRRQEIEANLPLMLEVAKRLRSLNPSLTFHCPHVDAKRHEMIREIIDSKNLDAPPTLGTDYLHAVAKSRLAIVASGTATLEVGLLGTPMVVIYKISKFLAMAGSRLLTVPSIAQVNLIAGREIAPEFLGSDPNPEEVAESARALLEDGEIRRRALDHLRALRESIGGAGASDRAADAILNVARR